MWCFVGLINNDDLTRLQCNSGVTVTAPGGEGHELRKGGPRRLREGLGLLYDQEVGRHLVNEALGCHFFI